ncbi:MarR family transcriptional regulator [Methylotenera sp.]|uniref:MarR family winged helix-turn-helix transcriptional regulator n=1 Tax=Methylotenera sp. TaxID=2051956 RepID=UPI00248A02BC|nr:MarR family transcriptional regulator [Methylotenera sp.]MDI1360665.1 MarR family transcriptional regulator [Methylotenera sp.]
MLQLKDLPDAKVLRKFAERYAEVDSDSVIHYLNILRIGTELSDSLDRFLATHGLLQGRWWVLILLMREDDLTTTPSELADKSGVSRATMSGLINGLLRDGLIARQEGDVDRRSYSVKLTEAGQAKLDEVMPDYYSRVKKMMGAIPVQQRDNLLMQLMLIKEQSHVFD